MKVIFLDIDGVLNSHEFFERTKENRDGFYDPSDGETWLAMLDEACVARLERLVAEHDAKVVISSSWRCVLEHDEIERLLRVKGFTGKVIGATTKSYGLVPDRDTVRGDQIQHWLNANPVDSYVILDDNSDMAHLEPRLVLTKWATGIKDEDVIVASRFLASLLPRDKPGGGA